MPALPGSFGRAKGGKKTGTGQWQRPEKEIGDAVCLPDSLVATQAADDEISVVRPSVEWGGFCAAFATSQARVSSARDMTPAS